MRTKEKGLGENIDLWMEADPLAEDIIEDIRKFNPENYDEVVFCGYGEPLMKTEEFFTAARFIKENYNVRIRVNTNGHANVCAKRDITPELAEVVGAVSISLNEMNARLYNELCECCFGERGFDEMIDFTKKCIAHGIDVTMSVVNAIPKDHIEECRKIAEGLGARFRVRSYIE